MLRLVHNRTMSDTEVQNRLEKSRLNLRDAYISELSLFGRFQSAYDAALESALALIGATNEDVVYGPRGHRTTFRLTLESLGLGSDLGPTTERMIDHHFRENRLFYHGETATDEGVVAKAVEWAQRLQSAVLHRLQYQPERQISCDD